MGALGFEYLGYLPSHGLGLLTQSRWSSEGDLFESQIHMFEIFTASSAHLPLDVTSRTAWWRKSFVACFGNILGPLFTCCIFFAVVQFISYVAAGPTPEIPSAIFVIPPLLIDNLRPNALCIGVSGPLRFADLSVRSICVCVSVVFSHYMFARSAAASLFS